VRINHRGVGAPASLDTIGQALSEIADGGMVVVVDEGKGRGDLVMAAEHVTAPDLGFIVRHAAGVPCVALTPERCDALELPLMVAGDTRQHHAAFTHSVDLNGCAVSDTSAGDRAATIRALADASVTASAFSRPGHVFPLRAEAKGVLQRPRHTEAAVDLARLAGLQPAGVLCEIVHHDGSMARQSDFELFAVEHGLPIVSLAALVDYRRRTDAMIERTGDVDVPTPWGQFRCISYRSLVDNREHLAFAIGDVAAPRELLVRMHSECFPGEVLRSLRCDCARQFEAAMERLAATGRGVVLYLRGHVGGGIALRHESRAYDLRGEHGAVHTERLRHLGFPVDNPDYDLGAQILVDLGTHELRMLSDDPRAYGRLEHYGLDVLGTEPLEGVPNRANLVHLHGKKDRAAHVRDNLDDLRAFEEPATKPCEHARMDVCAAPPADRRASAEQPANHDHASTSAMASSRPTAGRT
jgi:3,4-dihydroxy 2-butanone 4-phosphate synthase/GTP cyclohydrolase II